MRKTLCAFLVTLFFTLPLTAAPEKYGKGLSGSDTIKVSELIASPDKYIGKTVRVEGTITDVCAKRGCWMMIAGDKEFQTIRFKVDDGVIVIPMSAKGKSAVAEGVFAKLELTKEQAVEHAKHQAEEMKKPFDPASVTGPQTLYQLKGTGAVIK